MKRYATINGEITEAPEGALCYKYGDPTEDGRWVYDLDDRLAIEASDPGLIEEIHEMETSCR